MTETEFYGRTPLPAEARTPIGFVIPLWFAVIFSPFVAFAVNGKVDDSDWTPALLTAGLSLAVLAFLSLRTRANYRDLPARVREEYERGKCFEPLPAGRMPVPRTFKLTGFGATLELTSAGITYSPAAWLGANSERRAEAVRAAWQAVKAPGWRPPPQSIAWREIAEWQVRDDSDTADYYRLMFADGGHVSLRRPPSAKEEYALLDTVRSVGRVPVRLFCDIPRP